MSTVGVRGLIAGVAPLQVHVYMHEVRCSRSSNTTKVIWDHHIGLMNDIGRCPAKWRWVLYQYTNRNGSTSA